MTLRTISLLIGITLVGCNENSASAPPASLTWRGAWSADTTYTAGDLVRIEGEAVFVARSASTGEAPTEGAEAWDLFLRATPGPMGPAGPEGPQGAPGDDGAPGAQGPAGMDLQRNCPEGTIALGPGTCVESTKRVDDDVSTNLGALAQCLAEGRRLCSYDEFILAHHCFQGPAGLNEGGAGCYANPDPPLVFGVNLGRLSCEPVLQPPTTDGGSGIVRIGSWAPLGDRETWAFGLEDEAACGAGAWLGYRCCVDL